MPSAALASPAAPLADSTPVAGVDVVAPKKPDANPLLSDYKRLGKEEETVADRASGELKNLGADAASLKPPTLSQPPPPQYKETSPQEAWGSAAMVFAALGSLLTRQPLTTAMNAAAGVINAVRKGDQDAANSQFQQWKIASDNAMKVYEFQEKAYNDAMANIRDREHLTIEEANMQDRAITAQMKVIAESLHDQAMLETIAQRGWYEGQNLMLRLAEVAQRFQFETIHNYGNYMAKTATDEWVASEKAAGRQPTQMDIAHKYYEISAQPAMIKENAKLGAALANAYADPRSRSAIAAKIDAQPEAKQYAVAHASAEQIEELAKKPDIERDAAAQITMIDKYIQMATGSTRPGIAQYQKLLGAKTWNDYVQMTAHNMPYHPLIGPDMIRHLAENARVEEQAALQSRQQMLERPEWKPQAIGLGLLDDDGDVTPQTKVDLNVMRSDPAVSIQGLIGVPVQITSGARDPAHNAEVGGAPGSAHMRNEAWDFKPTGGLSMDDAGSRLAEALGPGGFDQIEITPTHVHVSLDPRMRGEIIHKGAGGGRPIPQSAVSAYKGGTPAERAAAKAAWGKEGYDVSALPSG